VDELEPPKTPFSAGVNKLANVSAGMISKVSLLTDNPRVVRSTISLESIVSVSVVFMDDVEIRNVRPVADPFVILI